MTVVESERPSTVRLELLDDSRVVLERPWLQRDTLVGLAPLETVGLQRDTVRIPVGDVLTVQTRVGDPIGTALIVAVALFGLSLTGG